MTGSHWDGFVFLGAWDIPVVLSEKLPVDGVDGSQQLGTRLDLQRGSTIKLAPAIHPFFGKCAREHHHRPGEVGAIGLAQLKKPKA